MKDTIKKVLREYYGEFNSKLERDYENKIISVLLSAELEEKHKWATYNQVILELKTNLINSIKISELQYRLTDNEDPSKCCLDVIESIDECTPEMVRLYSKIKLF